MGQERLKPSKGPSKYKASLIGTSVISRSFAATNACISCRSHPWSKGSPTSKLGEAKTLNLKFYTQPNCQLSRRANWCFWTCQNLESLTLAPYEKKKKYLSGFQKQTKKQNPRTSRKINQEFQEIEWLKKSEAVVADNDLEVKEDLKNRSYVRHWCTSDFSLGFKDLITLDYILSLHSYWLLVQWQITVIYLFLPMLGPHCCAGFSTVVASRGFSLVAVQGLPMAVASLVVAHGF